MSEEKAVSLEVYASLTCRTKSLFGTNDLSSDDWMLIDAIEPLGVVKSLTGWFTEATFSSLSAAQKVT